MMTITVFILSGCSSKNEMKNTVKNYADLLNEKNYEGLYENLTKESKDYIEEELGGKEGFINKYSAIYSAMNVKNIKIEVGDISDKSEIPMSISMDTVGGNLKYDDAKIKVKKEK